MFPERELKIKECLEDGSEKTRRNMRNNGQFIRETEKVADKQSWNWLKHSELNRETESSIFAAQEQALRPTQSKQV